MSNILQSGERSVRSVFVGNIPYDATEEKLKDIFSEVGPVVSFRLVYDRETGKPKGYGFCEYRDQETAMSAMRNLNRQELNSRVLRVDYAANEKTKEEIRNLQTSMNGVFESPYGPEIDPESAPEEITKVVASLPPEQMFELAKQMKQCIQTNPTEAKNMLIQNPQLCYGLLQALVVMRVVDSNIALKMLHRSNPSVKPLKLSDNVQQQQPTRQQPPPATIPPQMPPIIPNLNLPSSQLTGPPQLPPNNWPQTDQFGRALPPTSVLPNMPPTSVINTSAQPPPSSFDPRMYNRMQNLPSNNNLDPRIRQQTAQQQNSLNQQTSSNLDPRQFAQQNTPANLDPRARSQNSMQNNNNNNNSNNNNNRNSQPVNTNQQVPMFQNQVRPNLNQAPGLINAEDQEEQQQQHRHLMMQVMSLSDEQIAVLPLPQRQGILQLKQQIQASNMQL